MLEIITSSVDVANLHKVIIGGLIVHSILNIVYFVLKHSTRLGKRWLIKSERELALYAHYHAHPFGRRRSE